MRIGIAGYGWVGKAMKELFPEAYVYSHGIGNKKGLNRSDIVFICVPTPGMDNGRLDTSIVEDIISWCEANLIVVRSTVNPGDCDHWVGKYGKRIVFQPEYLGETPQHPLVDTKKTPFLILGGRQTETRKLILLYQKVYNANITIRQVTLKEAEVIKLSENRAIAFKVMQAQELFDVCEVAGIDYYKIRDAVYGDDPRFNLWWTFVYPEKRGFSSSKCLVKDVPAWCAWAESVGYDSEITKLLVRKSNDYAAVGSNPKL